MSLLDRGIQDTACIQVTMCIQVMCNYHTRLENCSSSLESMQIYHTDIFVYNFFRTCSREVPSPTHASKSQHGVKIPILEPQETMKNMGQII
jgi:hypothetical protein